MTKILIVDDRPINREVLSLILDENHYNVIEAEDGQQAIQLAKLNKPDLIISDIAMPGFDGISLAKKLNLDPILSSIPVIFYTASYKAAEAYQMASTSNVKYVLTKPSAPEIILGTIEGILDPNSPFFHSKNIAVKNNTVRNDLPKSKQKHKFSDQNLRLTNLIEIGIDMSKEHDIEKLTYIACKGGRQLLEVSYTGVILKKSNSKTLYSNFLINNKNVFSINEFNSEDLSQELQNIFIHDGPICIHYPLIEVEKIGLENIGLPFSSLLCLPVKTARGFYGKIYFINKENPVLFTLSHQRYMRTLADKFAINYENLLLYQEVDRYAQQLENEILQRKQTEEKLRVYRSQMAEVIRLSSLEELASSLAHEINQPLAAIAAYIKGCLKRIEKKKEITPEIISILNETVFQAERAGEVIHRIKSFVHKGELFFESVEINAFIKEVIHLLQQEQQSYPVKINFIPVPKLLKLSVDKIQLQQVILNLLHNAIEAMQEAKTSEPTIHIEVKQQSVSHILVQIIDNGPGFPAHLENNIFELYFTTKRQGMGMGLAICRSVIEAHAGHISARLIPEGGSCFEFDLPIKK